MEREARMGLFDRISSGISLLADRTNQALDEGKLRLDLMRVRRRRDNLARDLGYITFRQAKGTPPGEGEVDALVRRIEDCDADIGRVEAQIQQLRRREGSTGGDGSAPGQGTGDAGPTPDTPGA
jgi:hypothetical protein